MPKLFEAPVLLTKGNIDVVTDFMNNKLSGTNLKAWINAGKYISLDNHMGGIYTISIGDTVTFHDLGTHVLFI